MGDETSTHGSEIPRRTIIKAGAWTLPVIAAAIGTPAFAVSGPTITFDSVIVYVDHREDPILLDGHLTGTSTTRPAVVSLTYSPGFTGDATAVVDPETGNFRASAYADVGPSMGSATAAAPGYPAASVGMQVNAD